MNLRPRSIIAVAFLAIVALQTPPALAQTRVFVSAHGLDTNACSVSAPCRSFQHAHDVAVANGEIDVLDPGGYGAVNITKSISIQGHGFSGITVTSGNAISINAPESATINRNGLLIEGSGTGDFGVGLSTAGWLNITNTTIRAFNLGGLGLGPRNIVQRAIINVADTILVENVGTGATLQPFNSTVGILATFSRVQAFGNQKDGFFLNTQFTSASGSTRVVMVDCVATGNGFVHNDVTFADGIHLVQGGTSLLVRILRSVVLDNSGVDIDGGTAEVFVGQTQTDTYSGSNLFSFGDNYTQSDPPHAIPRK